MVFTDLTDAQENSIYDWVNSKIGSKVTAVYWSYQTNDVPVKPYVILDQLTASSLEQKPDKVRIGLDTKKRVYYNEFTLSVTIVDNVGNNLAKTLVRSLYDDDTNEFFKLHGVICRYPMDTITIPREQVQNTHKGTGQKYEILNVVDFVFAYAESAEVHEGEISTVNITNNL